MTSFYFQGLRKCFLEISIRLEVLLAALFISVSKRRLFTRVLQKVLSLDSNYFSAMFYQTYFYYKPSKYSPITETHFCNIFTQSQKTDICPKARFRMELPILYYWCVIFLNLKTVAGLDKGIRV